MKDFRKLVVGLLLASVLVQPLGLVTPVLAEEVRMEYPAPTDPDPKHIHAPKVVNGVTYEYDANGNLVNDGERKIEWNQDNKPIRITKGDQVVEFFYDAGGGRILKKSFLASNPNDVDTTIYVSGSYQKSVVDGVETTTKYYFANGRVAVRNTPSGGTPTLTYLHQDHLGSTVLATDTNSQSLSNSLSYFPYGSSISNQQLAISNYLFTGQELDDEASLYNYNARLYNPRTGAFISADTLGGGNRYAYAANNPMMFVDPSGNQNLWYWLTKIIAGGGRLGTSFFSGTFWAGVATWAGGVYAEAYAKYVQDQGFMPPLTPYEVGWYEPTPVDLSEEEYNRWVNSARAIQEVGGGIAELSAWGYLTSAGVRLVGETLHPGSIDREKVMGMAGEIAEQNNLNIEYDETGELTSLAAGQHNYDPATGVSTVTGPIKPGVTIHEDFHAWHEQSLQMSIPTSGGSSSMSMERWYTKYLPLAIQNEQATNAAASRYMFSKGEYLYGAYYDFKSTMDPAAYFVTSLLKWPDYWIRTIGGPK